MSQEDSDPKVMSFDALLEFRETTERISGFLHRRLKGHLTTLSPLFAPARVFGKHVAARESAPRADEALAQLLEKYKDASGSPLDLRQQVDEEALSSIGTEVEIYPYEYSFNTEGTKITKSISMTSPVRWVLTYGSEYSLSQMRNLLLGSGERRPQSVRQFVINALAFQIVLGRSPGATQLLKDLRYEIGVQTLPGLGKLPLMIFSIPLPSFRPSDDLLLTATRFSGVPAFIELIDTGAVRSLEDPLRRDIEALLQEPS